MKTLKQKIISMVLNYLIKDVLNFVRHDELYSINKDRGVIIIDSAEITIGEAKEQVVMIESSQVFQGILDALSYFTQTKAVKESSTYDDVLMAKAVVLITDYINKSLKDIKNS